jgi:hypothetical protein
MSLEQKIEALTARLQRLEDESAIRRVMAEMMKKADERENPRWGERLVEYYTEDGQWVSAAGFADVGMKERGTKALIKKFTTGTRITDSSHLLGSESITVDGDGANGSWLCFEPATLKGAEGKEEAVWVMARYFAEFRRVGETWKVRTLRFEGIFCTPFEEGWHKKRFVSVANPG